MAKNHEAFPPLRLGVRNLQSLSLSQSLRNTEALKHLPMLDRLLEIARSAGDEILRFYRTDVATELKADESPLTAADLASHRLICDALMDEFPDIPICSEEGIENGDPETSRRFWLVDPLDGTKEFLKQTGCFTVNIALIEDWVPVVGVIHVPAQNVSYRAARHKGAFRIDSDGEHPITISEPPTTLRFVASRDHAGPEVKELLARYPGAECLSIGSSLKFCLVAEGKADVYLRDVPTMEWDTAAAHAILAEAGGKIVNWPSMQSLVYGKPEFRNGSLLSIGSPNLVDEFKSYLTKRSA